VTVPQLTKRRFLHYSGKLWARAKKPSIAIQQPVAADDPLRRPPLNLSTDSTKHHTAFLYIVERSMNRKTISASRISIRGTSRKRATTQNRHGQV
jgi:hypothetical protein